MEAYIQAHPPHSGDVIYGPTDCLQSSSMLWIIKFPMKIVLGNSGHWVGPAEWFLGRVHPMAII